jgi:hypothetical protein
MRRIKNDTLVVRNFQFRGADCGKVTTPDGELMSHAKESKHLLQLQKKSN